MKKIKDVPKVRPLSKLLKLAFSSCFSLLLALNAGLLVALSLTELGENAGLSALTLKAAECIIQRLVFFNSDF